MTTPILATFPPLGDADAADAIVAASRVAWQGLGISERDDTIEDSAVPARIFALTAIDVADASRDAIAYTAIHLAAAAIGLGYSVLLIDADLDRPTLHRLPPFAHNNSVLADPPGVAEFLRGEISKLEPLIKMAWRTEGLLLLPAGKADSSAGVVTGRATLDRLLRLTSTFSEIVLLLCPPLFSDSQTASVVDLLPRAGGVVAVYPSAMAIAADTMVADRLAEIGALLSGAVVVRTSGRSDEVAAIPDEVIPVEEVVEVPPPPEDLKPIRDSAPPAPPPTVPSFLSAASSGTAEKSRRDVRRALPIETVSADVVAPVRHQVPARTGAAPSTTYSPRISLEMQPGSELPAVQILSAQIGTVGEPGPSLWIELRAVVSETKHLRIENPGTGTIKERALLSLETLAASDASEDALSIRIVIHDSTSPEAASLLDAIVSTPDRLRILSNVTSAGDAAAVRFDATQTLTGAARLRATIPPFAGAPGLFLDLEQETTEEGRRSRILLRTA